MEHFANNNEEKSMHYKNLMREILTLESVQKVSLDL